jgi:hypothetical protein
MTEVSERIYVVYLLVTLWDDEEADMLVGMRLMREGGGVFFFFLVCGTIHYIGSMYVYD